MIKKLLLISLFVSLSFSFNDIYENQNGIHTHAHSHSINQPIHEHTHVDSSYTYFYTSKENKLIELLAKSIYIEVEKNIPNPIKNNIFKPPIV